MSRQTLQRQVIVFEEAMAIRRKAEEAGIFDPSELALLARAFGQLNRLVSVRRSRLALLPTTWPA